MSVSDVVTPADAYRHGMRFLPAGVCLITSHRDGVPAGMIATAVTSVSSEPPTLLICVNRNASLFDTVIQSGTFCVNVLATEAVALVEQFSNSARRDERFLTGGWSTLPSGSPLCAQARVAFDCRVAKVVDWHSHGIFLGEVVEVVHPSEGKPLLYMDRGFHGLMGMEG
ncbi:flavin reductase family protein [Pseudomonas sp. dw_358]|uniref:flavin reductase family protein n=1 Tax=Pseudomonas sp. dw_358 TaxID=2720083 RepID=UPI001BD69248|nr:flavin reductase family protein [Pseudomonas sp. dw_358]